MPKILDEDQLRRKQALAEKRAARKKAKEEQDRLEAEAAARKSEEKEKLKEENSDCEDEGDMECHLLQLPVDSMHHLFQFLSAAELGRLTLTAKSIHDHLRDARTSYIISRLNRAEAEIVTCQADAEALLESSLTAGGDTGRLVPNKGKYYKTAHPEFISYARFLEEAVIGYGVMSKLKPGHDGTTHAADDDGEHEQIFFPKHVQGRFVSVSPEHSFCRVGGDGTFSGAGGSGVASWGIGRRGQLGHGKREDQDLPPKRLLGGFGYGIRIVQVAAGGGLVRVAHSLLLTSTGQVFSFGTGQYGALGHGYSAAKQLPDQIRPALIKALSPHKCVCVDAGELHSAAVTSDGDVYTWGDGFCGQLGHGDKRPVVTPTQVTKGGLEDECVSTISCGSRHTIAITEDGEAFTFGLGHFGVLGRSFTPFEYDADADVVALGGEVGAFLPALAAPSALGAGVQALEHDAAVVLHVQEPPAANEVERNMSEQLRQHLDLIANLSLEDSSDQCIPKRVESLDGIKLVLASAGHRHSLLLDERGGIYSCGSGTGGCLGHGDISPQMYPVRITSFDDDNVRIRHLSAGVDTSMAVSTTGGVYSWGKPDGGRIGLGLLRGDITHPRRVPLFDKKGRPLPAVDAACGYVHSLIAAVDGTVHLCGNVGVNGQLDSQTEERAQEHGGKPKMIEDYNIFHRQAPPSEKAPPKPKGFKKYGKYEIKGRSKMSAA
jgi:alpha-tubulin suppressor-like RCC1 family protein